MEDKKFTYKDVLSQVEFVKMMVAALINRFGDGIDSIASTWIVYQLTNSAAWSAVVYAVNTLPTVIITPLAGAWVEGRNKKRIMIITDLIRALIVAFVATTYLLGTLKPWMLIITNLLISTVEAFRTPADSAITPMVLDKELFDYGISLHNTLVTVVQLVSLAGAAAIIAIVGNSGALYIDMATFIASALIICFVKTGEAVSEKVKFNANEYVTNLKDGFVYIAKDKFIVFTILYAAFLNAVLVPLNSLQAPLASEILHSGVEILSILSVSVTIGTLVGSIFFPFLDKHLSGRAICALTGFCIVLFYAALVVAEPFYGSAIFVNIYIAIISFMLGVWITLGSSFLSISVFKKVNQEYMARTSSILYAACSAATPVTSFIVSIAVAFISVRSFFIAAAVVGCLIVLVMIRSSVLDEEKETATNTEAVAE